MNRIVKYCLILFFLVLSINTHAQLCSGSLGDPIVNITFGAGNNPGAPLSAATTAYQYVANDCPTDGNYTVRGNTTNCFGNTWHSLTADHTNDGSGYFMLVNASIQPSAFYIDTVRGLCGNSTYEFAAWITNVLKNTSCGVNAIQPNISFFIEKTDGTIIQSFNTGIIPSTPSPIWKQYGSFFTTPVAVTDVVLRMINTAAGGCGNDLALDDITFRPCGPKITPAINGLSTTTTSICEGVAKTIIANCTVSPGFNNPQYQWQRSIDGSIFVDLLGETSTSLSINFSSSANTGIYKYRLNVSENGNMGISQCRISSPDVIVTVLPKPISLNTWTSRFCEGSTITMFADGPFTYKWTGPNNFLSQLDTIRISNAQLINEGDYFLTIKDINGCENNYTMNTEFRAKSTISTAFLDSFICNGNTVKLIANTNENVEWFPASSLDNANNLTPIANPNTNTNYKVIATNLDGCKDSAFTRIKIVSIPIVNAGEDKFVVATRPTLLNGNIIGDYENFIWSPPDYLNSTNLLSPTSAPPFEIEYTLTAKSKSSCYTVIDKVFVKILKGIYIPNAFTPNADFKNDVWNIPGLEAYPLHKLTIFNRYGQKVFERTKSFIGWDGKFLGITQSTGSYTYIIDLKNGEPLIEGTFLLLK